MALRHVVLMRFRAGTSPETVRALTDALRSLPPLIPEIVDYRVGPDLDLDAGTWDFAVTADFDSVSDFRTYRTHPVHLDVIRELIEPHVELRNAVQFET